MYRDFIYLDINRVQSIIAQLQQGLLSDVMKGKTEDTTGRMQMAINLLAMMLPASVTGSVEHSRGSSLSESRVLHDYAFEVAKDSLEDEGLLVERDDLDWHEVQERRFVLMRGAVKILDYETFRKITENFDEIDEVINPSVSAAERKRRKKENSWAAEAGTLIDTFYQDAIRVRITNRRGCTFLGPLSREHLREDLLSLIYKYSSRPKGEWTMLAEVSRVPQPDHSSEDAFNEAMGADEESGSLLDKFDQIIDMFNGFQEFVGSVPYPNIAVSPVAVYREINT